jgi:accessory colonization factor AcfC
MKEIRVYGPGGPYEAVRECCGIWAERSGLAVKVIKGPPEEWAQEAQDIGDLLYFGAENMLEEFAQNFPGLIDRETVSYPFRRRIGIILRASNPRRVNSLSDLATTGVSLLAVELEKMDEFFDAVPGMRQNIAKTVVTGENAFAVWQSTLSIDAWITYRSWHIKLTDAEEFLQFAAGKQTLRATPLALTKAGPSRESASELSRFLGSEEGHMVFRKYGWE